MKPPKTVKQFLLFLQVGSWYHRFVKRFAVVATPFPILTKKTPTWKWEEDIQETAFKFLKTKLTTALVLKQFN